MAWQLYFHLADHARTLEHVAVYDSGAGTLTGGGVPERLQITRATPSLASVLRRAASGRPLVHRTRRRDRRCARSGLVPWTVGAEIRRRSKHRRPLDHVRRCANRSRRRHACDIQFPGPAHGHVDGGAVHTSQRVVPVHPRGRGTTAKWRERRERTHGNHVAHRGPVAHRTQPARADLDSHPAAGISGRTNCASTLDADGGGCSRVAGRVRKRRQPVPGPLRNEAT